MKLAFLFVSIIPLASCWGFLGHRTVAYLAQLHFTPEAQLWVDHLLHGEDISQAAIWPDKIAWLPQWRFTKPWHYIDAQDDPPHRCQLNVTRDCLGDCVISALVNHTARVQDETRSLMERGQSLRFVMHFFGDLHQPLHTENLQRGGNGIPVKFDGHITNLHSVWDSFIPNKHLSIKGEVLAARVWAAKLYRRGHLLECRGDIKTCSLEWAIEANQLVCSTVLPGGVTGLPKDLGGDYFKEATEVIDMQVQRAGRRLAAWINDISRPVILQTQ